MMGAKLVTEGFGPIQNEEIDIRGWAKTMLYFCEHVTALIDPTTIDATEHILKTEFPQIEILYQDRKLGDSDYCLQGLHKSLIMHNNITHFVQETIHDDTWFLMLAADERFAYESFAQIITDVEYARRHQYGSLCHEKAYEVIPIHHENIERKKNSCYNLINIENSQEPDLFHYVLDFSKITLRHARFDCKTPNWEKKAGPHTGYSERYNPLITHVPLWHFHRIKHHQIKPTDWRDESLNKFIQANKGKLPIMQMRIPFDDWQNGYQYSNLYDLNIAAANLVFKEQYWQKELDVKNNALSLKEALKKKIRLKNKEDRERYMTLGKYYAEHFDENGVEREV